ncbi:hypothetical protein [Paenibacillus xylanexedens]|uniref:hypothetical protein n=1 Tax=Paenibacillus xylanexedens TaxID=528191 RepID=UPI0011A42315|nr:hypothetical protein [Paenibacillus xylanexedens]
MSIITKSAFALPKTLIYCPKCTLPMFSDGPDHECGDCKEKFDFRNPNMIGVVVKEPGAKPHLRFVYKTEESIQRVLGGPIGKVNGERFFQIKNYWLLHSIGAEKKNITGDVVEIKGTTLVVKINAAGEFESISKQGLPQVMKRLMMPRLGG